MRVPKYIESLKPYKAGKPIDELAREKGLKRIVKLASNENPFGPSPKAVAAMQDAMSNLHRYVDPASPKLVQAIAEKFGKNPKQIIAGSGTDALIANVITTFTEAGDEILTSKGTFIGIYVSTNKLGRNVVALPLNNYRFDLTAIADAITAKTRLIFLANPNNPTGTMFERDEFERFMQRVPEEIMVILDEAYFEYASWHPEYPDGLAYDYPNLIVTRTFSKAYGLAGIRLGFAVGREDVVSYLYRVKLPFEPNGLAQAAGVGALADTPFLERTVRQNQRSLQRMITRFNEMGIPLVDSVANFVLLLMPTQEFAREFFEECLNRGLIVRHVDSFGIPNGIRINSGTDEETEFALKVVDEVYELLCTKYGVGMASSHR